jgi:electron transfer flavoprotein alpha subunit
VRIAVLVKQVPRAESLELLANGRLNRAGIELEMNAYCRRAVSKGVELARSNGGTCTVFTLGPPSAEDALREAIAWGADDGILVTDPAFAGSDTLATAHVMARAIESEGPFDLVLVGRNSIDADTGQVPPEIAELLDLPFAAGVKEIEVSDSQITARCELDDGWKVVSFEMPALVSVAERLCEPAKVDPEGRAEVDPGRIRRLSPADLGGGPFGEAGSPTTVGEIRVMEVERRRIMLEGGVAEQVAAAVSLLEQWGAISLLGPSNAKGTEPGADPVRAPSTSLSDTSAPLVAVVLEPGRSRLARELLGEAAQLAGVVGGSVVSVGPGEWPGDELYGWGADRAVVFRDALAEEDIAAALARWAYFESPWAVLVPGTLWGREVAGRSAARLRAGLTGDAVGLGIDDGRLVAWKPAFGGMLVAAITTTSPVQMATVRPGVLDLRIPRALPGEVPPDQSFELPVQLIPSTPRRRVTVLSQGRDDDVEALLTARVVVGVGAGVPPDEYPTIRPLTDLLDAQLAASRKVTDKGWLPRARQVGITGQSIAPALYVALGVHGKFNHMIGTRSAGTVVAVNLDPRAPIFEWADIGIVGDWREVVAALVAELRNVRVAEIEDD